MTFSDRQPDWIMEYRNVATLIAAGNEANTLIIKDSVFRRNKAMGMVSTAFVNLLLGRMYTSFLMLSGCCQ